MSGRKSANTSGPGPPSRPAAHRKPATTLSTTEIGPHNFKDHFDPEILGYVNEDIRLSTLQRRLVRENNMLISHALACQVSINILKIENSPFGMITFCFR